MNSAIVPLVRLPVGVVVERRKAQSQWADFVWRATAVLPDKPDLEPWTVMRDEGDVTAFYAGSATVDLYRSETARYRENLTSGAPGLWVVLSPSDGEQPYTIAIVTADPAEGESYTGASSNLVEEVAMPDVLRHAIDLFVAEHHVERTFVKRKRGRADPEALARREPGGRNK